MGMKKLAVGVESDKELIDKACYYVDKPYCSKNCWKKGAR